MFKFISFVWCFALLIPIAGCGTPQAAKNLPPRIADPSEPSLITVQHVLIGFDGSLPGKAIRRTKEEAEELAKEILAKAQAGDDFDALVETHTDDSPPGIYRMSNFGVTDTTGGMGGRVYPRDGMVPAFGDVGFPLNVGEVGLAGFDETNSPYGWHVVKRIK